MSQVNLTKPVRPAARKAVAKVAKPAPAIKLPLQLGVQVRDLVSGLTGIANAKIEMLNGNVQWNVMPKGDGAELKIGNCIDWHMLEVIGEGVSKKVPVPAPSNILLGSTVVDQVTKFKGTITERTTFINGCVYYHVAGRASFLGRLLGGLSYPEGILLEHKRLKVLKKPAMAVAVFAVQPEKAPPETPKVAPKPRATGGPTRSIGRMG